MKNFKKIFFIIPIMAITFILSICFIPKKQYANADTVDYTDIISNSNISLFLKNSPNDVTDLKFSFSNYANIELTNQRFADGLFFETFNSINNPNSFNFQHNSLTCVRFTGKNLFLGDTFGFSISEPTGYNVYFRIDVLSKIIYEYDNETLYSHYEAEEFEFNAYNSSNIILNNLFPNLISDLKSAYLTIPIEFNNQIVGALDLDNVLITDYQLDLIPFSTANVRYYPTSYFNKSLNVVEDWYFNYIDYQANNIVFPIIANNSYNNGYEIGYEIGYDNGHDNGYVIGYENGDNHGYSSKGLFHNIIDSLSSIFEIRIGGDFGLSLGGICLIGVVILSFFALIKMLR